MKISLSASFLLPLVLASAPAWANPCSCEPGATPGPETIFESTTVGGARIAMRMTADPITRATKTASVCTQPARALAEVKLWMPSMGHGSAPTRLVPVTSSCTRVERINFLMTGDWQLRVKLAGGDSGVFDLWVVE